MKKMISGIDEAGRGPIIGPMVMAIVIAEEKDLSKMESWGVKDSKLLTPKKREELSAKIKKEFKHEISIIQPKEIDSALLSDEMNLNKLEAKTSAFLINKTTPSKTIVDCPSNNTQAYKEYLQTLLNTDTELVLENKADEKYVIVGAASILAKVTRDKEIEKIKKKLKADFGSGYPSDPKTREFVEKNFDNERMEPIFRKSWDTYKKLVEKKSQRTLLEI